MPGSLQETRIAVYSSAICAHTLRPANSPLCASMLTLGYPARTSREDRPAVVGGECGQDRGLLSAQLLAGTQSRRTAQRRSEAASYDRRAGENKNTTRQNSIQGPAQHPETTRQSRTILPSPGCEICRLVAVISCRINNNAQRLIGLHWSYLGNTGISRSRVGVLARAHLKEVRE